MFDMLLESGRPVSLAPSWGRCAALALHVVVLGALWRPPATQARDVPIVISDDFPDEEPPFLVIADPPPPAPQPGDQWMIDVAPPDIPSIPGGTLNTRFVITPGTPGPGSPVAGESPDAVYSTALVQEFPELLTAPPPAYPVLLREAGVQGHVIVAAVVDTLGRPEAGSLRIVLSDDPGFDAAALATVRGARFRPARIYGRAVRVLVQVPVVFRLS